jgi:hypothetical protein
MDFKQFEPAKENRFLVGIKNYNDIHPYNIRKYKLFTQNNDMILSLEIVETVEFTFDPFKFLSIKNIKIDNVNAIGDVYSSLNLFVTPTSFFKEGDYSSEKIAIVKTNFIVDMTKSKLETSKIKN